jgi:hypothetical protein
MHHRRHFNLRAVGFTEGREWAAICLETGYLGYGGTFADALIDLIKYHQGLSLISAPR